MWPLLRRFLFLLDPEDAHTLSKWAMRLLYRFLPLPRPETENPIGLAAGFDKNAELIEYLPRFGFGSVEIGTVTPMPQGGNERPRLFRDPARLAVFNRMGFNNLGAGIISAKSSARVSKEVSPASSAAKISDSGEHQCSYSAAHFSSFESAPARS